MCGLAFQLRGELLAEFDRFVEGTFSLRAAHRAAGEGKRTHLELALGNFGISGDRALATAAHRGEKRAFGRDTLPSVEMGELLANGS